MVVKTQARERARERECATDTVSKKIFLNTKIE
jgi:hypothetical protein